jgi:hypothetical protein
MKIRSARAELFQSDGQTDITKLILTFRYFKETLKMGFVFILEINKIYIFIYLIVLYFHNVVVKTETNIHFSPSSQFRIFI